jgi:His/Glu/Gln/Arg/opine family amino acid ABC transporter permease subunit
MYVFDWSVVTRNLHLLLPALQMTFKLSITAEILGLIVGLIAALARSSKSKVLSVPTALYVDAFRSVPLLVLLIWMYYGISIVIGVTLTPFQAGVLGLGLFYGAYLCEVFRSGLQAIPKGQREAALTLGLGRWQAMYYVVLPQAVRIVSPALVSSYIGMMKDATLVSVIGLTEFMRTAQTVVSRTFRPFEVYTFVAIVYLVLTLILGRVVAWLERRAPLAFD